MQWQHRALILLSALSPAPAAACDGLEQLHWMLGDWRQESEGQRPRFELWAPVSPGTYEGTGGVWTADGPVVGEDLRLVVMMGQVFYLAKVPGNDRPIAFGPGQCGRSESGSSPSGREAVMFANPTHDFPRRLEYRLRDLDTLEVTVSDGEGQGFTLEFRRVGPPMAAD